MATTTIAIADKPTLDEVKTLAQAIDLKCNDIYDAVISGSGGVSLDDVEVFVTNYTTGEAIASKGVISKYERKILPA